MRPPALAAKSVLIRDDGKVLILTRSETDKNRPGELDLPGGSVDPGESYEQAAIREIEEEIGVVYQPGEVSLAYTETTFYEDRTTFRFMYTGKIASDAKIVLSYEHSAYAWMGLAEIEAKYNHPVWVKGMQYANEHGLLPAKLAA